jgi:penicillin amidase
MRRFLHRILPIHNARFRRGPATNAEPGEPSPGPTSSRPRSPFWKRAARVAVGLFGLALLVALALALFFDDLVAGSLPPLSGTIRVAGLQAEVRIERDHQGVPAIHAGDRLDLAFGLGFVHGQDRFFQMDLLRRHPAGELAALVGRPALPEDRRIRVHRFRHRAHDKVERMSASERALISAYTRGVEAGRGSLRRVPFEYLLLGALPAPWQDEDTVLVVLAMFEMLQGNNVERELNRAILRDTLPPALADFLSPGTTPFDAALDGSTLPFPPLPPADVLDLRKRPAAWEPRSSGEWRVASGESRKEEPSRSSSSLSSLATRHSPLAPPEVVRGSNNWAVAGSRTVHGGAIVANDMHLGLMAPNTWYRAAMYWKGEAGEEQRLVGVTLPGTPGLVAGSNGRVAWGFTNTEGDWSDVILLEPDPSHADAYRTPEGPRRIEPVSEIVRVKGEPDQEVVVEDTVWGPVLGRDRQGRRLVLRWVAHDPDGVNLESLRLETARTVEEALALAPRAGIPAQNLVVADAAGNIAWTVLGRIPRRIGFDGGVPVSWADGSCRWDGWLKPEEYPRVVRPKDGILWTANNRVIGPPALYRIGLNSYDHGARARQIRDDLGQQRQLAEADMLAIQLDNRALFLARWRDLLLEVLNGDEDPDRVAMREAVRDSAVRADVDAIGFRIVKRFRTKVREAVLEALTVPSRKANPEFHIGWLDPNVEESVWQLITRKPPHLLPPRYPSWDARLLEAVDGVRQEIRAGGQGDFQAGLARWTWGGVNRASIRHPLSGGLGRLSSWLEVDMPHDPLPGDSSGMPRILTPSEGASERFAVSPGREEQGYFHMPTGQSGHPLSPHYRDGHAAWVKGEPTPFLPGPARNVLTLVPLRQ